MRMFLVTAMAAAAVAALSPYPLAAQTPATAPAVTPPPPMVKPGELRKVSDHVQIIPDDSVQLVPNVGYVVGDKAVLVIDTGMGPKNGAAVSEIAQKLAGGTRAVYLVTTHFHPEHDLGAQAFPASTKLIRSEDQQKDIAEFGLQTAKVFASRGPVYADLLKDVDFRKPDTTFAKDYDLDLGGVHAKLTAMGPNHTRGDLAIWVEPDHVLFTGDIAMKAQPAFASPLFERSSVAGEPRQARGAQTGADRAEPWPDRRRGLHLRLSRLSDRHPRPHRGGEARRKDRGQAVAAVSAALPNYPDRGRLTGAIKAAYGEAP